MRLVKFSLITVRSSLRLMQYYAVRCLSTQETATALRPFYFAVHPDLFGRFPKAQATNEDSLKRLNEHLGSLNSLGGRRQVAPISLLFYVRNTATTDGLESRPHQLTPANFKAVRISLLSTTLRDAVKTILRSCNLPLSYIESIPQTIPPAGPRHPDRPIRWHHTYYKMYGVPNPQAQEIRKKAEITLSMWLQKNLGRARTKLAAHEPLKVETQRLVDEVKKETGLAEVRWQSSWGISQYRACLKSFLRLYENNKLDIDLTGHTLVFASETGVCIGGHVILRYNDIPDGWLPVLLSVDKHDVIHNKLPAAEKYLSTLLNDIKIVRRMQQPVVLADTYLHQLRKLCQALKRFQCQHPDDGIVGDLSDVEMMVTPVTGSLVISQEGQVLIPASSPAFLITDFLNRRADEAREAKQEYERSNKLESQLVAECVETLGLKSLTKDQNITSLQMEASCVRLLEEQKLIHLDLEGCRLKVTQFYSVMSDGEMCIPWKWKTCKDMPDN